MDYLLHIVNIDRYIVEPRRAEAWPSKAPFRLFYPSLPFHVACEKIWNCNYPGAGPAET